MLDNIRILRECLEEPDVRLLEVKGDIRRAEPLLIARYEADEHVCVVRVEWSWASDSIGVLGVLIHLIGKHRGSCHDAGYVNRLVSRIDELNEVRRWVMIIVELEGSPELEAEVRLAAPPSSKLLFVALDLVAHLPVSLSIEPRIFHVAASVLLGV